MTDEKKKVPKKYWWLVVVALPVTLAIIAILPALLGAGKHADGKDGGHGDMITTQSGSGNVQFIDTSTKMTVINNVSVIAKEYEKYTGQPLKDEDLKQQIQRAVEVAAKNDHEESIRLLREIASKAPLPAIYNNLGVEYAKAQKTEDSKAAFRQAIAKDPNYEKAQENLKLLAASEGTGNDTPPRSTGISFAESSVAAIVVDNLKSNSAALEQLDIVDSGSFGGGGSFPVRYQAKPGATVAVEPGKYDIVFTKGGSALFILAKDVEVKEQKTVRINPDEILGSLVVEPLSKKGFPEIKEVSILDPGTGQRALRQRTEKPGESMPLTPGTYDVLCKTVDGSQFELVKNVVVKARQSKRVVTNDEIAAIVVYEPKISGLEVKAIYALRAGTDTVIGKADQFGKPIMVYSGESYDVALQQPSGLTRIKKALTPARGMLTEVR